MTETPPPEPGGPIPVGQPRKHVDWFAKPHGFWPDRPAAEGKKVRCSLCGGPLTGHPTWGDMPGAFA